jgi:3-oxoacyl-[acyl-carrier-protein] synthase-1
LYVDAVGVACALGEGEAALSAIQAREQPFNRLEMMFSGGRIARIAVAEGDELVGGRLIDVRVGDTERLAALAAKALAAAAQMAALDEHDSAAGTQRLGDAPGKGGGTRRQRLAAARREGGEARVQPAGAAHREASVPPRMEPPAAARQRLEVAPHEDDAARTQRVGPARQDDDAARTQRVGPRRQEDDAARTQHLLPLRSEGVAGSHVSSAPLILCLSEDAREDVMARGPVAFIADIAAASGVDFDYARSRLIFGERTAVIEALRVAEQIVQAHNQQACYVGACDSLLPLPRLMSLVQAERVKTLSQSDGFIPAEGAGIVRVVGRPGKTWLGLILSTAQVDAAPANAVELPGSRSTRACRQALGEAGVAIQDVAVVLDDVAGEARYFEELAVTLTRLRPRREQTLVRWSPSFSTGETGTAAGAIGLAYGLWGLSADRSQGGTALQISMGDDGRRGAVCLSRIEPAATGRPQRAALARRALHGRHRVR